MWSILFGLPRANLDARDAVKSSAATHLNSELQCLDAEYRRQS